MMMTKKILVIEDEPDIQTLISYNLSVAEFKLIQANDGEEGIMQAQTQDPDLIVLDWMLPFLSGIEILRRLRSHEHTRKIPLIMLTAKSEESDQIRGLDNGADDYMTKPFSPAELIARIRALLRRADNSYSQILKGGDIELDITCGRVRRDGKVIHLGPTEFRLLEHFLRGQGRVYSRISLLNQLWGDNMDIELRTIDVHIRRLRKALNYDGKPDLIRTVRSMGYAFEGENNGQ